MTKPKHATPTFLVIGHAAQDLAPGGWRWGGTVTYAALLARAWKIRTAVLTSLAPRDVPGYQALLGKNVGLHALPAESTTVFENVYTDTERRQRILAQAAHIEPRDVPPAWRDAPIVLVAPLMNEVSIDFGWSLPRGSLVGMTIQGRMRSHRRGRIYTRLWHRAEQEFPAYDALFYSTEDVQNSIPLAKAYAELAPIAVMTRGEHGATLFARGCNVEHPACPAQPVDPTGAGDVFAAAFMLHYARHRNVNEACRLAGAAAACSIERLGAKGMPSRRRAAARMRSETV